MSKREIDLLIEGFANKYAQAYKVCTPHKVQACAAAFMRLMEECGPPQALVIADVLLGEMDFTHPNAWDWLIAELYFEAYAVAFDDRAEAAVDFLRHRSDINDQALDSYNARIDRFN